MQIPGAWRTAHFSGVAVRDLQRGDFRVYADGVPQEIRNLWADADLPLTLGVILDVSESQSSQRAEQERAVNRFLEQMIGAGDHGFVVMVNENVVLKSEVTGGPYGLRYTVPLTPRGEPLGVQCGTVEGARGRKRSLCGGTALWNSVYAAAHLKLNRPGGSKALIILSDGNDTGSTHSLESALEEVQRSGAVVYGIRYPDTLGAGDSAFSGLSRLAEQTGGMFFDPAGTNYPKILARMEADLRSRYVIGFQPGPGGGDGARHSLRVEMNRPGLTVRARTEYFGAR